MNLSISAIAMNNAYLYETQRLNGTNTSANTNAASSNTSKTPVAIGNGMRTMSSAAQHLQNEANGAIVGGVIGAAAGAVVGGVIGGVVGFFGGGPLGAAVGAWEGGAAGMAEGAQVGSAAGGIAGGAAGAIDGGSIPVRKRF